MLLFFFSMIYKTFEAKIHHLETRLSRKPREGTAELEYFVRCEVHSSDLNTFISSIKRVAEDVRTTKEDKCKKKKIIRVFCLVGFGGGGVVETETGQRFQYSQKRGSDTGC